MGATLPSSDTLGLDVEERGIRRGAPIGPCVVVIFGASKLLNRNRAEV